MRPAPVYLLLLFHVFPAAAETADRQADGPEWIGSIRGDRWQVGVSMERGVVLPSLLVERSLVHRHRVGLRVNVAGVVNAVRADTIPSGQRFQEPYLPIVAVAYRSFLFSDSSRLALLGISLGADGEAGFRLYQDELTRQVIWGVSVGPTVGFSLKLFTWLWIEATAGSCVRLSRMTKIAGDNESESSWSTEVLPTRRLTIGASF